MADAPPPLSYAAPALPVPPPPAAVPPEYAVARELAAARLAWRPVRRAIRYATFDGWSLAVFAGLSALPCMGFGLAGVVVAVLLGAAAAVELMAVRRLRRLDVGAVRPLVVNQLALGVAVLAYAGWNLYLTSQGRGLMAVVLEQVASQSGQRVDAESTQTVRHGINLLYGILAVLGPAWTGGTAWLYAVGGKRLRTYLARTPPWALQMHREHGSV